CTRSYGAVDHIRNDDDHRDENLRAICDPCHARKTARESGAARRAARRRAQAKFRRIDPGVTGFRQHRGGRCRARMPGAKWSGEHSPRNKMQRYDIVCIHTIVGYAPAHAAHFSTSGGGTIWQSRDTKYRSAANLNGNHRVIAIENADHGAGFPYWDTNGSNVPPFTDKQI